MAKLNVQKLKLTLPTKKFLEGDPELISGIASDVEEFFAEKIASSSLPLPPDQDPAEQVVTSSVKFPQLSSAQGSSTDVQKNQDPEYVKPLLDGEKREEILEMMNTEPTSILFGAKSLYKPVRGTSSGSRYFVVGYGPSVAVAARVQGSTVSVRIEGSLFQSEQFRERLVLCGFDHANKGDYASVHVSIGNDGWPGKVIGSCLFVLSEYLSSPIPDISLVSEAKGS